MNEKTSETMNQQIANHISKDDIVSILDRNTVWIENCDSKASIMLGFLGVLFTVFFVSDFIEKVFILILTLIKTNALLAATFIIVIILSICAIAIGCFFLAKVLYARTSLTGSTSSQPKLSLIFFTDIAKRKSISDYKSDMLSCCEDELINDLISQIYICAAICDKKFGLYKKGVMFSLLGFASFLLTTLLLIVFL